MGRKGTPSLEELSAVIATIHDAGLDSAAWPSLLQEIAGLFRSSSVSVWMQGTAGDFRDMHAHQRDGEITRDYADFAAPRDLLSCMQARVFDGPGYSGYVGIGRANQVGSFEREDIRLLRLLLPHLRGAQRTRQHLAFAASEQESALAALDGLSQGVLIVDTQARVLHANPAAEALLRTRDGLTSVQSRLRAMRSADDAALRRALGEAAGNGGSTLAIARPSAALRSP